MASAIGRGVGQFDDVHKSGAVNRRAALVVGLLFCDGAVLLEAYGLVLVVVGAINRNSLSLDLGVERSNASKVLYSSAALLSTMQRRAATSRLCPYSIQRMASGGLTSASIPPIIRTNIILFPQQRRINEMRVKTLQSLQSQVVSVTVRESYVTRRVGDDGSSRDSVQHSQSRHYSQSTRSNKRTCQI
jgi:hypothetical protein